LNEFFVRGKGYFLEKVPLPSDTSHPLKTFEKYKRTWRDTFGVVRAKSFLVYSAGEGNRLSTGTFRILAIVYSSLSVAIRICPSSLE